ncbi:hypothetical protein K488DRAFT_72327 [Vararia minispora EC-137]|uniref:Uncharacterized protein n=1 Tax=Vararia minispora EC-137 TaxID=1314806 RepID=A0ACB8QG25_9AGAM|nr:hypothetical protein K488DRAFT_72327 [Vararia minispora EC-137]
MALRVSVALFSLLGAPFALAVIPAAPANGAPLVARDPLPPLPVLGTAIGGIGSRDLSSFSGVARRGQDIGQYNHGSEDDYQLNQLTELPKLIGLGRRQSGPPQAFGDISHDNNDIANDKDDEDSYPLSGLTKFFGLDKRQTPPSLPVLGAVGQILAGIQKANDAKKEGEKEKAKTKPSQSKPGKPKSAHPKGGPTHSKGGPARSKGGQTVQSSPHTAGKRGAPAHPAPARPAPPRPAPARPAPARPAPARPAPAHPAPAPPAPSPSSADPLSSVLSSGLARRQSASSLSSLPIIGPATGSLPVPISKRATTLEDELENEASDFVGQASNGVVSDADMQASKDFGSLYKRATVDPVGQYDGGDDAAFPLRRRAIGSAENVDPVAMYESGFDAAFPDGTGGRATKGQLDAISSAVHAQADQYRHMPGFERQALPLAEVATHDADSAEKSAESQADTFESLSDERADSLSHDIAYERRQFGAGGLVDALTAAGAKAARSFGRTRTIVEPSNFVRFAPRITDTVARTNSPAGGPLPEYRGLQDRRRSPLPPARMPNEPAESVKADGKHVGPVSPRTSVGEALPGGGSINFEADTK